MELIVANVKRTRAGAGILKAVNPASFGSACAFQRLICLFTPRAANHSARAVFVLLIRAARQIPTKSVQCRGARKDKEKKQPHKRSIRNLYAFIVARFILIKRKAWRFMLQKKHIENVLFVLAL